MWLQNFIYDICLQIIWKYFYPISGINFDVRDLPVFETNVTIRNVMKLLHISYAEGLLPISKVILLNHSPGFDYISTMSNMGRAIISNSVHLK